MSSRSDDLLALSSVEMRRRIGSKEISPVELLEAAIARIEALNPAVNAIAATDYERARKVAKDAETAARKGEPLGPLHGLPTGIKDLHETGGPAHDLRFAALSRFRARPGRGHGRRWCARRAPSSLPKPTCRNSAQARTRATWSGARPAIRSTRCSMPAAHRAELRLRSRATCCRCAPGRTPADRCAYRRRFAGSSAFGRRPDWCRRMAGRWVGRRSRCWGRSARSVADLRQLFSAQIGMDDREPLAFPLDPAAIAVARPVDLGALRVGLHRGLRSVPGRERHPSGLPQPGRGHAPPLPCVR